MREFELGLEQRQESGNTTAYNEVPRITDSSVESRMTEERKNKNGTCPSDL
jgi:hypothetical protein